MVDCANAARYRQIPAGQSLIWAFPMLTFHDPRRFGRRDFLRIGAMSLGGIAIALVCRCPRFRRSSVFRIAASSSSSCTAGPSQIETFDPKMDPPAEIRSATGEIATAFPASRSAPRSRSSRNSPTGWRSFALTCPATPITTSSRSSARTASAPTSAPSIRRSPARTIPTPACRRNLRSVPARRRSDDRRPGTMSFGNFAATGPFSPATAPFLPGAGGSQQKDMKLALAADRFDDRRSLLRELDRVKVSLDEAQRIGVDGAARKGREPAPGRRRRRVRPVEGRRRASSAATTRPRWSGRRTSTRSGRITTTTSITPRRSASCCCWRAGCANAGPASSP